MNSKSFIIYEHPVFWLVIGCVVAAIPGFCLAPYSIHEFDEPYQILNAYDWKNSVYSPLSAFLGHIVGEIFGWKYLVFRRLLICLTTLSIFFPALYALNKCEKKYWILVISVFSVYFATVFKSDMNIYGWDNWTVLCMSFIILTSISLIRNFSYLKVVLLAALSAVTLLMRIPNASLLFFCVVLIPLYAWGKRSLRCILMAEIIYIAISLLLAWLILVCLYGSIERYLILFDENRIGSHSVSDILRPSLMSFIYLLRVLVIVLSGYGVIYLAVKKVKIRWISGILIAGVAAGYLFLLYPLSRNVLGNIAEEAICMALSGIILILARGFKFHKFNLIQMGFALLFLCSVPALGSNWGFYKYMAWPVLPLLAWLAAEKLTLPVKWYCGCIGIAFLCYSVYAFYRPTFFDKNLNTLTYRLSGGVLDGMYTNPERGKLISELEEATRPYAERGYEIIPIRWKNEYLWEFIYLSRNPYQRHTFDYLEAFDDKEYVTTVVTERKRSATPSLILFMGDTTHRSSLMYEELCKHFKKVDENDSFAMFVAV